MASKTSKQQTQYTKEIAMTTAVNYTADQTAKMVFDYKAGVAVEAIAVELGKSVRSVVAKLSREGAYVAKGKTAAATNRITKSDLVSSIADLIGSNSEALVTLEKASKEALEIVEQALAAR